MAGRARAAASCDPPKRPKAWNIAVDPALAQRGNRSAVAAMAQVDNHDRDFSASPHNAAIQDTDPWAKEVPGIFDDPVVRERMIELIVKAVQGRFGHD
jgi:hypothetical protein